MLRASLTLCSLAFLSSCTIWLLVWQDPQGLPCAPGEDVQCLAGYTCVDGVCLPAAGLEEGDACEEDEQCSEGLVCTNAYEAASCGDDITCGIGRGTEDGASRRCRRICNPNQDAVDQCPPGNRCYPDAVGTGWCQSGVCATPSQCGENPFNGRTNVCFGAGLNPGGANGSGLCTSSCDPLQCNPTTGCPDCPIYDVDGDGNQDAMGCEPFEGILDNMGCVPAGGVPHGQTCDGVTTFCQPGAFCFVPDGGNGGYCARICRIPAGGNPACDVGFTCTPITNEYGFCQ